MKLFGKIRNLLFEEVPEETKNDNVKDEIDIKPSIDLEPEKEDKKEDNMEDIISERELFKSETTFKFPVIFEDEDFLEEKKNNKNKNVLDFEALKIREEQQKDNKDTKVLFRVSPIISPVYGILDKNYRKEDITTKEEDDKIPVVKEGKVDFDIVRKKAYGTLTDELEEELELDDNKGMFFNLKGEDQEEKVDDTNLLYDMSEKGEDSIVDDITLGAAEDNYTDFGLEYSADRKIKDVVDDTEDDNLFNLIDSMYEEKEE